MSNAERIIRLNTVLARTGLSRATIYRKIAEGTFPRNVKISIHGTGWHESEVNRWIANPVRYRADNDDASRREDADRGEG
ncbi:helix-turn-helix transcriptional regulator [Sphingomonas oryzagri]